MTDEQLRAALRRVLELTNQPDNTTGELRYMPLFKSGGVSCQVALDRAVAILREELAKAQHPLNDALDPHVMTDEEAEALLALPVTQAVSIDT